MVIKPLISPENLSSARTASAPVVRLSFGREAAARRRDQLIPAQIAAIMLPRPDISEAGGYGAFHMPKTTPATTALRAGGTIPTDHTLTPVEVSQVLDALTPDVRDQLTIAINSLG